MPKVVGGLPVEVVVMLSEAKGINVVWLSKTGLTNMNSGEGGSNFVDVKKFSLDGKDYPYVSGQAMRFYLKETIRREVESHEACVVDENGEACGRVKDCVLCDLFGFMTTLPEVGAITRVSPIKVSPAMGLLPFEDNSVVDFLTRRHRAEESGKLEGDIVHVEMGVNLYKAGVALDLAKVGCEETLKKEEDKAAAKGKEKTKTVRNVQLEELVASSERERRVHLMLNALKYFADYSKQARLLTDFTPDLMLLSVEKTYSHRLQKAWELDGSNSLNVTRLGDILEEVASDSLLLLAGSIDGVVDNQSEALEVLKKKGIPIHRPRQAIDELVKQLTV